jgi:aspartate-semialdehyde dehydrogenase
VGQRFVQLLDDHPWFEVKAITASDQRAGSLYGESCRWILKGDIPEAAASIKIVKSEPELPVQIVFSALPSDAAKEIEPRFARAGYIVCSNASAYRQMPGVPLLIPEVNAAHLVMLEGQRAAQDWAGLIVTSPNCTTTGLAMTLKPLNDAFGVRQVFVTTLQAVSGAGYPGVPFLDIADNIIPNIPGEEEKIRTETCLLLGKIDATERIPAQIGISVQVNRVPVVDGHTLSLAVKLDSSPTVGEAVRIFEAFRGPKPARDLPSALVQPIIVRREADRPQPKYDRDAGGGLAVTVGRIRSCPILDLRMVSVVHNTLRGAASGSILNAELLVSEGYVDGWSRERLGGK